MVATPIPAWLEALDEKKPYIEVLDGERQPDVSPHDLHGRLAGRVFTALDAWAGDAGRAGVEIRYYFEHADGTWSSVLPDVAYMSEERLPQGMHDAAQRPRIAPDIAFEIVSPSDRPGRLARKIALYLEFGATVVLVIDPVKRTVAIHRPARAAEHREARGAWALEPFDGLVLDWEQIYRGIR